MKYGINDNMILVQFDRELVVNQSVLEEYFITKAWISTATYKKLTTLEKITMTATVDAFAFINRVGYVQDENVIAVECDIEELTDDQIKLIVNHIQEFVNNG